MTKIYKERLFEIVNEIPRNAVRDLLISVSLDKNRNVTESLHWKRIINYARYNNLCEFNASNLPVNIRSTAKQLIIAYTIRDIILNKRDLDTEIPIIGTNRDDLQLLLNNGQVSPFELKESKVFLKNDWQFLFNEKDPKSITNWLGNYFRISAKFFDSSIIQQALLTGLPQWQAVFGNNIKSMFDLERFDAGLFLSVMRAMHESNSEEHDIIVDQIKQAPVSNILDVGGATGALSRILAATFKSSNVTIYEKEALYPLLKKISVSLNLSEQSNLCYALGDFFKTENNSGLFGLNSGDKFDLIVLGWIIHDWNDTDSINILRKIKYHLNSTGRILLLEKPLDENGLGPATSLDLTMLLQTGGKERTIVEYEKLAAASGLKIDRYIPTKLRRDLIFMTH